MTWEEMNVKQRVAAVKAVLATQPTLTATELGLELCCSHSAVLGVIHRQKIPWDRAGAQKRRFKPKRQERRIVLPPKPPPPKKVQPPKPMRHDPAFDPLPGAPAPVSLADLPKDACKWPIGDDPILFCGCASETGRYCPTHESKSGVRLPPLRFK